MGRHENSPPRRKMSRSPLKRRQSSDSPPRRRRSPDPPSRRKRSPKTQLRGRNGSPDSPPRRRRSPDSPQRRKRSLNSPSRRRRSPETGRRRSPYRRERKYSNSAAGRSRSPYRRKTSSPSSSPPRRKSPTMSPPPKKKAGLDIGRNYRKKSPVMIVDREKSSKKVSEGPIKKAALTDSEKQAKLAEMMANATWRDQQRTSRVQNYREGLEKEEAEHSKEHDKNFINRELK